MAKKKVVVAMSGGVDSSVAAALLMQQGYEVLGAFMRLGSPDGVEDSDAGSCAMTDEPNSEVSDHSAAAQKQLTNKQISHKQGCCSVLDAGDARRVAGMLSIPFYVLNFQDDFDRVIDYFVCEYNRGRTPNPCVRCNDWLKFGRLAQYAQAVGADYVASGHYARIGPDPITGEPSLLRGIDHRKDQSYVLFGMTRHALAHTLLPIGAMEKHEVRAIAQSLGLPVFNKPDSQEICFVPDQDYAALLRRRSPEAFSPGDVVDGAGAVVGHHAGHQHFTIGQRKGVGVAMGRPMYVVDIEPGANRVILGEKLALRKSSLIAKQINVLSSRLHPGEPSIPCSAKIRYNHAPQPAKARLTTARLTTAGLTEEAELHVTFDEPQSAITPGQAMVLYDGEVVLGGGWIESAI